MLMDAAEQTLLDIVTAEPMDAALFNKAVTKTDIVDIADSFEAIEDNKLRKIFRLLPKDIASDVFAYISPEKQQLIIEKLTDTEVGSIINDLFADDAVDFIEEMPADVVNRILRTANAETRVTINKLLKYDENSTGGVMTVEYIALYKNDTVATAFDIIRKTGVDKETIYTCYIVDSRKKLVGAADIRKLLLAEPNTVVDDIAEKDFHFAYTHDDKEETAKLFTHYDLVSLPVVDKDGLLVGIVTVDDVVDILEEEATEDFQKMAAMTPSDTPYMKTSVFKLAGHRILWLLILMLSATITGGIITSFESSLAALPVLIAFIPMLMDTGGNSGAQSSTLIIRGMAVDEIHTKDVFKVLGKELRVALICGLVLAAVNFVRVFITNNQNVLLCIVVSLALLATVIIAKTFGVLLPMLAKKCKLDPAIMASPLITTLVDAISLIIYFSIARTMLGL
jgi:magnesium transporter